VPTASSLSPGQFYTAKYFQTLSQQQELSKKNRPALPSSLSLEGNGCGKTLISKRPMSSTGDHVTLWTAERLVSGVLVPVVPLALIMPCAPLDYIMAFALTIHSHWYEINMNYAFLNIYHILLLFSRLITELFGNS